MASADDDEPPPLVGGSESAKRKLLEYKANHGGVRQKLAAQEELVELERGNEPAGCDCRFDATPFLGSLV